MKLPQSILRRCKIQPLPRRERMAGVVHFWMDLKTIVSVNAREHWAVRMNRVQMERHVTRTHLQMLGKLPSLPCVVTMTRWAPKKVDAHDNLRSCFKSLVDEICEVLGVDDGDEARIRFEYAQKHGERPGYGVEVTIQSVNSTERKT